MEHSVAEHEHSVQNSGSMSARTSTGSLNISKTAQPDGKKGPPSYRINFKLNQIPVNEVLSEISRRCKILRQSDLTTDECHKHLEFLRCTCLKRSVETSTDDHKETAHRLLAFADHLSTEKFPDIFMKIWEYHFRIFLLQNTPEEYERAAESFNKFLYPSLSTAWNSTDKSVKIGLSFVNLDTHKTLLTFLKSTPLQPTEMSKNIPCFLVKGIFGILHNVIQILEYVRQDYRDADAVDIISKYRAAPQIMVQCKAEILLAYILDEDESDKLNSNPKHVAFIVSILKNALENPTHRSAKYGFSALEIVRALNKLSANEVNKQSIASTDALQLYTHLLGPESNSEEQAEAAKGLWSLAFGAGDKIRQSANCLDRLRDLAQNGSTADTRKQASGALWKLEEKDVRRQQSARGRGDVGTQPGHGHIMISYQWTHQKMMLKLKHELKKAGYKVWIDVEQISGSILEAMATAVEEAEIVLVTVSQAYKESPNGRTEGEYAFTKRKQIIPLLLQERYRADGWLGALITNKLYYDFSLDSKFSSSLEKLIHALGDKAKGGIVAAASPNILMAAARPALPSIPAEHLLGWKQSEVYKWLQQHGLDSHQQKFDGFDGVLLAEYKSMLATAPEFFYQTLKQDLQLPLPDILRFTRALKTI